MLLQTFPSFCFISHVHAPAICYCLATTSASSCSSLGSQAVTERLYRGLLQVAGLFARYTHTRLSLHASHAKLMASRSGSWLLLSQRSLRLVSASKPSTDLSWLLETSSTSSFSNCSRSCKNVLDLSQAAQASTLMAAEKA